MSIEGRDRLPPAIGPNQAIELKCAWSLHPIPATTFFGSRLCRKQWPGS
jgi:hypothetical protein